MAFDDLTIASNPPDPSPAAAPAAAPASNRAFVIAAGALGGLALLSLLFIAGYALFVLPGHRAQQAERVAALSLQNTQVAEIIGATQTAAALQAAATATPTATQTPLPATPTPTAVLVIPTTAAPTEDPRTPTVAALLTQAAASTQTPIAPQAGLQATSAAPKTLPKTGFADEVGLPATLAIAGLLLAIIFITRRLRAYPQ